MTLNPEFLAGLTGGQWMMLLILLAVPTLFAVGMLFLDHVAAQWQADQDEASQPSGMGTLPPRTLGKIPPQRTGDHDRSGS